VRSEKKSKPTLEKEKHINDAVLALVSLGYKKIEANKVVRAVSDAHPRANVERLVKEALTKLSAK